MPDNITVVCTYNYSYSSRSWCERVLKDAVLHGLFKIVSIANFVPMTSSRRVSRGKRSEDQNMLDWQSFFWAAIRNRGLVKPLLCCSTGSVSGLQHKQFIKLSQAPRLIAKGKLKAKSARQRGVSLYLQSPSIIWASPRWRTGGMSRVGFSQRTQQLSPRGERALIRCQHGWGDADFTILCGTGLGWASTKLTWLVMGGKSCGWLYFHVWI